MLFPQSQLTEVPPAPGTTDSDEGQAWAVGAAGWLPSHAPARCGQCGRGLVLLLMLRALLRALLALLPESHLILCCCRAAQVVILGLSYLFNFISALLSGREVQ